MNLKEKYTEELIYLRKRARDSNYYDLSDLIRTELDSRFSFVFDTPDGQVIYHELKGMTRAKVIEKINKNIKSNNVWDARLYTLRKQNENEEKYKTKLS